VLAEQETLRDVRITKGLNWIAKRAEVERPEQAPPSRWTSAYGQTLKTRVTNTTKANAPGNSQRAQLSIALACASFSRVWREYG